MRTMPISRFMTADVVTVDTHEKVAEAMRSMQQNKFRHLCVDERGALHTMLAEGLGDLLTDELPARPGLESTGVEQGETR